MDAIDTFPLVPKMSDEDMVTLRDYLTILIREMETRNNERFRAQEEATRQAFMSSEKAILKAEVAADKRFESVNEFRAMVNDLVRTMMPRAEADNRHAALVERVENLTQSVMPRAESDHRYTALQERVAAISIEMDKRAATGVGIQKSWGLLAGVLGVVAAVTATFFLVFEHVTGVVGIAK